MKSKMKMQGLALLAAAVLASLLWAPGLADLPLAGEWVLITVTEDGTEYSVGQIPGMEMRFDLREDGTATGYSAGVPDGQAGTWTAEADGVTIVLDDTLAFTLGEDGLLRGQLDSGSTLTLRRLPRPVAAAGEKDFEGSWTLVGMTVGDSYREAARPGSARLEITGTGIDFILLPEDGAEPETDRFEARFEGGVLLTEAEGMTIRVDRTDMDGVRFTMAIVLDENQVLTAAYWFAREK